VLSTTARNGLLDTLDAVTWLSLHYAYSTTGLEELGGGSPAYSRIATSFTPAVEGIKTMVELVTFDVHAGATVAWIGLWTAATGGTFWGMVPNGGEAAGFQRQFVTDDASSNQLKAPASVMGAGEPLVVWVGADGLLPFTSDGMLQEGTIYYAGSVSPDAFTLSTISGGTVLDLTATGTGYFQRIAPTYFPVQGTFRLNALTFMVDG
jgi:hypothetical protein